MYECLYPGVYEQLATYYLLLSKCILSNDEVVVLLQLRSRLYLLILLTQVVVVWYGHLLHEHPSLGVRSVELLSEFQVSVIMMFFTSRSCSTSIFCCSASHGPPKGSPCLSCTWCFSGIVLVPNDELCLWSLYACDIST